MWQPHVFRPPVVLAALGVLLTLTAAACAKPSPSAQALNHQANLRYAAGDYGGALPLYQRAAVLRPDLPALNYNTGTTLSQQSNFQQSIMAEQQAALSTDLSIQDRAFYTIGNDDVRLNQLSQAVDAYKSALLANPADVDAKYNLEVIQRRLAAAQAREQALQKQAQQPQQSAQQPQAGQPSQAQAGAAGQPSQSGQPGQQGQGQSAQNGQPSQSGQPGQPSQSGQTGQQSQPSQNGQAGQQGQPGQQAQANAAGQPSGAGAGATGGSSSASSGYTGTTAPSVSSLDPALQQAIDQFNRSKSISDAQRALNIIGQEQQISQTGRESGAQPNGRDW